MTGLLVATPPAALPVLLGDGARERFVWDEFFRGRIRNRHTRLAYERAVRRFLAWCHERQRSVTNIQPGDVGCYLDEFPGSVATRKLQLAALRAFFDALVSRNVLILNPALSVRGERYSVVEGKTPEITKDQVRRLLLSIDTTTPVGLRDKAIIATLVYTAARAGAVANLRLRDVQWDGSQYALRFHEKGGKSRLIPVRHDLQALLLAYLNSFAGTTPHPDSPLFRTAAGRTGQLTAQAISGIDICRLVKRRLANAGLPTILSPHSFRVATVTDLLSQNVDLTDVQYLAGHADARTTRLYDRRQRGVTRNLRKSGV